ncbi:putative surface protease GP63 [Trypanosoma cruzi]|nr:putative surface protease GP63 [Trypanosoma cruzi]
MEEGEANRSGTQGSTACTYGESGPSCRHPSRSTHTHKKVQCPQQHKSKVTIKKERSPQTTWIVGPREVQPIFITKTIQLPSAFVHIQRTPLHAGTAIAAAAAVHAKMLAGNGIRQATIYLCFCLNVGRCLHALFCFCGGQTFMPGSCVGDSCRVHNYVFFLL